MIETRYITEYTLNSMTANCHLPNSYRSISLSNLGRIYEKVIQQETVLKEKMSLPIKKK